MDSNERCVVLRGGLGNAMLYVAAAVLRYGSVSDAGIVSGVSVSSDESRCEHMTVPAKVAAMFPGVQVTGLSPADNTPSPWRIFSEVYDAAAGRGHAGRVETMCRLKSVLRKSIGGIRRVPDLGIHVRGRDYLYDSNYVRMGRDFVEEAFKMLPDDRRIMVFTDDVAYARDVMAPMEDVHREVAYSLGPGTQAGLISAMASCSALVRTSSTLSWWAAVLGDVPDVVTTFPVERRWEYANAQIQPGWKAIGV